ncbi:unnamed protein product [Toxocara canis]|uniref:Cadherin domain-containing protein n=1 Tax=Toxocara canis TaxID=6265 RepID=A0A183U9A6_TOXCA|nr:unnamed protein product [Toxocara canis]
MEKKGGWVHRGVVLPASFSVAFHNNYQSRTQVIRIEVLDVDEPPAFENGPKPYLAVVPYDRPIGMHVYKVNKIEFLH